MFPQILKSISSLLFISRITGFYLFTIDPQQPSIRIKPIDCLFILLTVVINATSIVVCWKLIRSFSDEHDIIVSKSMPFLMFADLYDSIFASVWLFAKRMKFLDILMILNEIDERLEAIGVKVDYERHKRTVNRCILVVVGIFMSIVGVGLTVNILYGSLQSYIQLAYSLWCFALDLTFILQYILSAAIIGVKFEALNRQLGKLDEKGLIQRIHMLIARYIRGVNEIYGPPLVANLAIYFCLSCFFVYRLITVTDVGRIATSVLNILLFCTYFYFMLTSIERTERARRDAIEMMIEKMHDNPVKRALYKDFMMELLNVGVAFSCGLFDLNWKFLYHLIASASMYFIALLQFRQAVNHCYAVKFNREF